MLMEKMCAQRDASEGGMLMVGGRMTMKCQLSARRLSANFGVMIHWMTRAMVMGSILELRRAARKVDGDVEGRRDTRDTVTITIFPHEMFEQLSKDSEFERLTKRAGRNRTFLK